MKLREDSDSCIVPISHEKSETAGMVQRKQGYAGMCGDRTLL